MSDRVALVVIINLKAQSYQFYIDIILNYYRLIALAFICACMHARLMAAIFDFRLTQTSDGTHIGLSVLPDPENMGIAVRISLLSCIRAEIYVIPHLLPKNGRHL